MHAIYEIQSRNEKRSDEFIKEWKERDRRQALLAEFDKDAEKHVKSELQKHRS